MRQILGKIEPGGRVLFIRLRSMGDCVLTTPALRMLASHRPDLEIGVMVDDAFAGVYEGLPFVHRVLRPLSSEALRFHPSLCVNLHGGTRSALLTAASLARFRAGFGHFRFQPLYNVAIPRAQEILGEERVVHTAEHVASALFYLGLPVSSIPRAALAALDSPIVGRYAVLHPFASAAAKTWESARFVQLALWVRSTLGLEPLILAGPAYDVAPFAAFRCEVARPLSQVKALLRGASLFVGNDSGPAHIAAAFDVPLVVLFGPSDPTIWAPWRASRASVVTSHGSMDAITLEQVQQAVERVQ
jgi:ADP-heptose:LPS heptosyltransferase